MSDKLHGVTRVGLAAGVLSEFMRALATREDGWDEVIQTKDATVRMVAVPSGVVSVSAAPDGVVFAIYTPVTREEEAVREATPPAAGT